MRMHMTRTLYLAGGPLVGWIVDYVRIVAGRAAQSQALPRCTSDSAAGSERPLYAGVDCLRGICGRWTRDPRKLRTAGHDATSPHRATLSRSMLTFRSRTRYLHGPGGASRCFGVAGRAVARSVDLSSPGGTSPSSSASRVIIPSWVRIESPRNSSPSLASGIPPALSAATCFRVGARLVGTRPGAPSSAIMPRNSASATSSLRTLLSSRSSTNLSSWRSTHGGSSMST